jgi:hypothetical protein
VPCHAVLVLAVLNSQTSQPSLVQFIHQLVSGSPALPGGLSSPALPCQSLAARNSADNTWFGHSNKIQTVSQRSTNRALGVPSMFEASLWPQYSSVLERAKIAATRCNVTGIESRLFVQLGPKKNSTAEGQQNSGTCHSFALGNP